MQSVESFTNRQFIKLILFLPEECKKYKMTYPSLGLKLISSDCSVLASTRVCWFLFRNVAIYILSGGIVLFTPNVENTHVNHPELSSESVY